MLSHKGVWAAIDALAGRHGLSASGLAKRAGLDPTTFNKSKRISREGKPRWPSTESVSKVLEATSSSLGEFVALIGESGSAPSISRIPMVSLAKAREMMLFDQSGRPFGSGWDEVAFPELRDPGAFAVEVNGDSMLPAFRDGDMIVVSPAASIRRGDRVLVKYVNGEVGAHQLLRRTARRIELQCLNPAYPNLDLDLSEMLWVSRIVWASQ